MCNVVVEPPLFASGCSTASVEGETKSSQAKDRSPLKNTKGSLGSLSMLTGKTNETGKETTANGVLTFLPKVTV